MFSFTLIDIYIHKFYNYVVQAGLQNTVFLVLILAALYLMRHKNAKILKTIALLGMVKLLIPLFWFSTRTETDIPAVIKSVVSSSAVATDHLPGHFCSHNILFFIWAAIIAAMIVRLTYHTIRLSLFTKKAQRIFIEPNIEGRWLKKIKYYISSEHSSPLAFGLIRKKIVLPAYWHTWSREQKRTVLAHELAHFKQRDLWIYLLQFIAVALNFYNPLVWILNRKVDRYIEMTCDDEAINMLQSTPIEYAKDLVNIAEKVAVRGKLLSPALAFSDSYKELHSRIAYQFSGKTRSKSGRHAINTVVVLCLVLLIAPLSRQWQRDHEIRFINITAGATAENARGILRAVGGEDGKFDVIIKPYKGVITASDKSKLDGEIKSKMAGARYVFIEAQNNERLSKVKSKLRDFTAKFDEKSGNYIIRSTQPKDDDLQVVKVGAVGAFSKRNQNADKK